MATLHLFILGTILLVLLLRFGFRRVQGNGGERLPPGPPPLLLLFSAAWLGLTRSPAETEPLLQRLFRRYGPIMSLPVGSRVAIFIADRRLAHTALVEHGAALADRPNLAPARLLGGNDKYSVSRAGYGPVWRLLRRNLVTETLHPSRARRFAPARLWARRALVEKLRRHCQPDEEGDGKAPAPVLATFQYAVFGMLLFMCFGERPDEDGMRAVADAQREQQRYMFSKMSIFAFLPPVAEHLLRGRVRTALSLRRRQKEVLLPLIHARREYKKKLGGEGKSEETTLEHSYVDTLFDLTLPEEGDRPLTDDEIVNLCSEFLTAGTDTTSTALQWIMAELVKNQAIQKKLYEEIIKATKKTKHDDHEEEVSMEDVQSMPYLKAVVLEGLRKHPPAHFVLPHMAAEDVEVGRYLVPKGATVNFVVAEMGRDEREWKEPMEFIPERFLAAGQGGVDVTGNTGIRMMPFGVGRRICPALNIAMIHLLYLVANMVSGFQWKEAAGQEVDFAEKLDFTVVMKKQLRPRLVPRKPNVQTEKHL